MPNFRAIGAIGAIALAAACGSCTRAPQPGATPAPASNILLITIDTLRADRIGRGLTPSLDALAARGVRFSNARSTAPLTLPAHASIMTGALPPRHGARVNGTPVPNVQDTIASRLNRAGYRTGAVVGAFVLDRRFGLAHGFDDYDDRISRDPKALDQLQAERRANLVVDAALSWLGKTGTDRPWFLWVHLYDPHAPYEAPVQREANASLDAAYDQEVAYADGEIGRLLSVIAARPDASPTAIIALGDHGESLGEHGEMTHGMLLFEPALRVPLIVVAPGLPPATRAEPVSLVDVLPTALALARQPSDTAMQGRNLLAAVDPERETYAETEYPSVAGWRPARVLVQDRWKLIASTRPKLFDLTTDSAEKEDVSGARSSMVQAMQRRLDELSRAPTGTPPAKTIDADTAARLRSLGYVAPATSGPTTTSGVDAADVAGDWGTFEQALSAQSAGRPSEALERFKRLADKHPDGAVFVTSYARALAETGRSREALAVYQRAVQRWPGDASLYHELAVAARQAGDRGEANRAEQAALTLAPDLPVAHNGLGLLHADEGRHAEAAGAFTRATELDPTNASYLANLGNAYRAAGDLDRATGAYQKALDRDPTLADAANGMGVVLVQQKRAADAIKYFEQAVAQDVAFGEAHLNLGIALQEAGQRARALHQYKIVEQLKTATPRDKQAARTLRAVLERR
jgi:arylsulfatase A-like enzyme/Tfp pilus assembly protein PilF